MIDALLWVGGVAVGLTFGFGVGRRRLEVDDQQVAETIAHLRYQIQDNDLQLNAMRVRCEKLARDNASISESLVMAEQCAEHQDDDLIVNAGGIAYRMMELECDELKHELAMAHQRAEHPDTGRYGQYTTSKGANLRIVVLGVVLHNGTEYAMIAPAELPGATPYMVRYDAVTLDPIQ